VLISYIASQLGHETPATCRFVPLLPFVANGLLNNSLSIEVFAVFAINKKFHFHTKTWCLATVTNLTDTLYTYCFLFTSYSLMTLYSMYSLQTTTREFFSSYILATHGLFEVAILNYLETPVSVCA